MHAVSWFRLGSLVVHGRWCFIRAERASRLGEEASLIVLFGSRLSFTFSSLAAHASFRLAPL